MAAAFVTILSTILGLPSPIAIVLFVIVAVLIQLI